MYTLLLLSALSLSLSIGYPSDSQQFVRCPSLTHMLCLDGLTCIRKSWMCDGKMDCGDQSDEQPHICQKRPGSNNLQLKEISVGLRCPPTWFRCIDSSNCVAPDLVCNNFKDCRDGSDERENCNVRPANTTVVY